MAKMEENSASDIDRMAKMLEQSNLKITMSTKKELVNKGAWTPEEDRKLAEVIAVHGAKKWKTISTIAGLNRCGKSCRLRWLNYLRPNIKRGNMSDQEEDLILRLHKLLGNRWSLIAGRLPGRTDNEIKNYWNSHLSKKIMSQKEKQSGSASLTRSRASRINQLRQLHLEVTKDQEILNSSKGISDQDSNATDFDVNNFFDFSNEEHMNLEWMSKFLEKERSL